MTINVVTKIDDLVKVRNVLISVSDKDGLETFVPDLIEINPNIKIFSTGGTYGKIKEILENRFDHIFMSETLIQVSDYTGQPETQGGLVKTLDFKIYLGLLTETYNNAHQADLRRTESVPIDMVVANLYPFEETVARPDVTVEQARGNIDIGGPCMIRAAAKNFIRVASVVNPDDYYLLTHKLAKTDGFLDIETRYSLARDAFKYTANYDRAIADFLGSKAWEDAMKCYSGN